MILPNLECESSGVAELFRLHLQVGRRVMLWGYERENAEEQI